MDRGQGCLQTIVGGPGHGSAGELRIQEPESGSFPASTPSELAVTSARGMCWVGTTYGPCSATQGPPTDCEPTNDAALYRPVLLRELSSPEWRRTLLSTRHPGGTLQTDRKLVWNGKFLNFKVAGPENQCGSKDTQNKDSGGPSRSLLCCMWYPHCEARNVSSSRW